MARQIDLILKNRELTTNGDVKTLRKKGIIPGVIYGKKVEPINVMVDKKYFMSLLMHSLDEHIVFNVTIEGMKKKFVVIMKERQWDPIKQEIMHIDFKTVDLKEEIELYSEFKFIGVPKGVKQGGIIEIRHTKVKGKGLPLSYPKFLELNIENLAIGDVVMMKDITTPESLKVYFQPEEIILTVNVPKKARGEAKEAIAAAAAEPAKAADVKKPEDKKK